MINREITNFFVNSAGNNSQRNKFPNVIFGSYARFYVLKILYSSINCTFKTSG